MNSFLKVAIQAAKTAGKIQKKHYGKTLHIKYKSKNKLNLVTQVDQLCEKAILAILRKNFPTHGIWAEESGRGTNDSPYTWFVDPLDGTTNFAHSYPFFCVSIALAYQPPRPLAFGFEGTQGTFPVNAVREMGRVRGGGPQILAAVVYDVLRNECFTAVRGKGAFLNGKKISVSKTSSLEESLVCTGFAYAVRETRYNLDNFEKFVLKAQGVRRDGSAALNLAYVAAGRFDGFWERGIQAWDMAAGVLLVQEAGGKVNDVTGKPFDLMAQNALASNGKIHDRIFQILKNGKDEKSWAAKWAKRPRPE